MQAAKYEGYTVWFNSLLASAGGSILDRPGKVAFAERAHRGGAAGDAGRRDGEGGRSVALGQQEDEGRLAFQAGTSAFMVNYTVRLSGVRRTRLPKIFRNLGVALWPRVNPDEPAHVSLGGFNIGVGTFGEPQVPGVRSRAAAWSRPIANCEYAIKDGLPPVTEALYQDPRFREAYPYADLLLETIRNGFHPTREPGVQRHLARRAAHAAPAVVDRLSSDVDTLREHA